MKNIHDINSETNPIELFNDWLNLARQNEINDPEAMALATADKNARPSVRMLLLKEANENGFKFHTNAQSQKGNELLENPFASLCFYWKSLRKQVRVEGKIEPATTQEANEYFANRPYMRQIGAHASAQSRPLESRAVLEEKIAILEKQYPEGSRIPRPDYWQGYRLIPSKIEFWWDNPNRLHDRIVFSRESKDAPWTTQRLYP